MSSEPHLHFARHLSMGEQAALYAGSPVATAFLQAIIEHSSPDRFHWTELNEADQLVKLYGSTSLQHTVFALEEDAIISVGNATAYANRAKRLRLDNQIVMPKFDALQAGNQSLPFDVALKEAGWTETYAIGLYANPAYGSLVVDLNAWDGNDPASTAIILASINASFDSFIGFAATADAIDSEIHSYIDRYKSILTKEKVASFGPKFVDQVEKARFESEAESAFHEASYRKPDSAICNNSIYAGKVASHDEFSFGLQISDAKTVNVNKVDVDNVPVVGETVLIQFDAGRGAVSNMRSIEPAAVLGRGFVGKIIAHTEANMVIQDLGKNTFVAHSAKHLEGKIDIGESIRINYDAKGIGRVKARNRAAASLGR